LWELLALALGASLAFGITQANPAQMPDTWWMLCLAGAIAICAMILPGISGSFILLLLGLYPTFLAAITSFDLPILASFAVGCLLGLLSFSHLLSWLLHRFHGPTLAGLTGFLLGSLQMIWPWKQTVLYYENRHGEQMPLVQENLWPGEYGELMGGDPQLWAALIAAVLGIVLVLGLEQIAQKGQFSE